MTIASYPAALQPIIQQGYLERAFEESLKAKLGYDSICDVEPFAMNVGETITKTRFGRIAASPTPLNAAQNTNFDNGLTPDTSDTVEQFTMSLAEYGTTKDLNVQSDKVAIASRFMQNAKNLGEAAFRTRDILARDKLHAVYLGGNTRVTAALGAPATTVEVDDLRGFMQVFSNGVLTAVSGGSPMTVTVGSDVYSVVGFTPDAVNASTAPGGISGTLTMSGNVTVNDGAVGSPVVSSIAPRVIRPNNRLTTADLVAGDLMTFVDCVAEAAAQLRDNGVPDIDGCYNAYLDNRTNKSLLADPAFQLLFRGTGTSAHEIRTGMVYEVAGVRFIPTNMAPQQTLGGLSVKRTLVVGQGALIRGDFAGQDADDAGQGVVLRHVVNGIAMLTRQPMDRFGEIVAQSWKWTGGYAVPSDTTANPTVIPTASNSAYKRGIVIESVV